MNITKKVLYQVPFCHFVQFPLDSNDSYGNVDFENESFDLANQTFVSNDEVLSSGDEATMKMIEATTPTASFDSSVWGLLSYDCRLSTIITGGVGLLLLILGLIFNIMLISAGNAAQQRPLMKKNDNAAVRKREAFEVTLLVSRYFRGSLGVSFILASVLLLLFIALSGYEVLYSNFDYKITHGINRLKIYKTVSCVVFHAALSASVYTMLGSVLERWIIIGGIDPANYLEKVNYLMNAPSNKLQRRSTDIELSTKKSKRRFFVITYLVFAWIASIAFGILTVVYCKVQFLLFGELYQFNHDETSFQFFLLLKMSIDTMTPTSIIYIVFLFFPLITLILCLSFTQWFLLRTNNKAKKLKSYKEAKLIAANGELPLNHKLLQITQSCNSRDEEREERSETLGASPREERPRVAEYSHRMEHEQQVTLNCQETGLNGIQTDSIQVTVDPASDTEDADAKAPLPPDWLKFSSISPSGYSDNPAVRVDDLANSSLAVSVDSARCFFDETSETRATLVVFSAVLLFTLPLCAVIAIDLYANGHSIFRRNSNNSSLSGNLFNPMVTSSIGICALGIFLLGGVLPFMIFYCTSPLFQDASKRMCNSKNHDDDVGTLHHSLPSGSNLQKNSQSTLRNGIETNGSHSQRRLWSSKRPESLDIEGWRPEERPISDAFPENRLDIERRFQLGDDE